PLGLRRARRAGVGVRYTDTGPGDCTLDQESRARQCTERTRLVAVGCASNAVGTINDVHEITKLVRSRCNAWVFLDAVHFAPHGVVDVQQIGCDFLACSAYTFFGPPVPILSPRQQ